MVIGRCITPPLWRRVLEGAASWLVVLARVPWYPIRVLVRAERCRTGRHEGLFGTCRWCEAPVPVEVRLPLTRRFWPRLYFQEIVSIEPKPEKAISKYSLEAQQDVEAYFTIDYSYPPPTKPPLWRRAGRAVRNALLRWSR